MNKAQLSVALAEELEVTTAEAKRILAGFETVKRLKHWDGKSVLWNGNH